MAAELIAGALVKASLGELLKRGIETIEKGKQYENTLERSIETLNSLAPIVKEIKQLQEQLDHPIQEIQRLENYMKAFQEVVDECSSSSKWGVLRILFYPSKQTKLKKKEADLTRHLSMEVALQNKRELMDILLTVKQFFESLKNKLRGLRGVPLQPDCIGMENPLNWLRTNLLGSDASVLVLTALGGSGKSTLAKNICWDPKIEDKFGENIFFFTVSKRANLMNIVESMFEYCGCRVPKFQSDEDAANRLGPLLLRHFEENPILLVLDDVWSSSETLVEKLSFPIPNYKILVTSRSALSIPGSYSHQLTALNDDNSVAVFRHYALNDKSPYMPDEKRVKEIVRCCKGSPLVLKVTGGLLWQKRFEVWQSMEKRLKTGSVLDYSVDLLRCLQQSVDMCSMEERLCFMDLGLFPEDQRIPVSALIDMWSELYDENDTNAMVTISGLTDKNLINIIVTRKVAKDEDMYYNNHFVMLHDFLRQLAIRQGKKKPFEERERLNIELKGSDRPEWCVEQNQQGSIGRTDSFTPGLLNGQEQIRVAARSLSISTHEKFTSDWCDMLPDKAEVLILNHHSSQYSLPEFTIKMSELKVLIVTYYGLNCSELNKFELLSSLSNLRRIRLEKVSVPSLCILKNLKKLSLHMCNTKQAFESGSIKISDAMPNLVEMSIDYCKDLVKLPDELCNITKLEKLSITNCHGLSSLPKDIANLENLEVLRLCSCSNLVEMPNSVAGLDNLNCIDISDCINLANLPDDIGKLKKLEKLYLKGCSKLGELPSSVYEFRNLNHTIYVICDEERAALWENFPTIPNLIIEISREETNLNWLHSSSFLRLVS